MLDLKLVRDDPERVKAALAKRGPGAADQVDRLLEADAERRRLVTEVEALRAEQKRRGREVAKAARSEERQQVLAGLKELSDRLDAAEERLRAAGAALAEVQAGMPNLPDPATPAGGEEDSVELRRVGTPRDFDFPVRDHLELGELLGAIDTVRAAKVSGARFGYLVGPGALLEFALVRFAMDRLTTAGFVPVVPPVLVRREAMFGTGFLPTDEQQIFRTADDDLYLAGTSEVPLVSYHSDELLDPATLPLRYAGFSTCFRREAGSYGKDTRGIFRVHQFDKVEMVSFVLPEESAREHELLLAREEEILQALELPYRVVDIAAGDLGGSAARKFDCEAWIPSQGTWRELTSTSNCTDYQARRIGCRVKGRDGNRPPHTLNGTAVAVGRTIVALLENHQQADGSVRVPDVLRPYLDTDLIKPAR
jgi:seryl-tRNA synthetase